MLKIGIAGCTGRMGRMLVEQVLITEHCQLAAASERTGLAAVGQDIGMALSRPPLGITITDDMALFVNASDAVIDFTSPDSTMEVAKAVARAGKVHVIGTTGLSEVQKRELKELSGNARIVLSPNMSLGVNLLIALVEQAAARLGPEYDIEILEMHHRHKVDSPSGTALALGEAAARGRFHLSLPPCGGAGEARSAEPWGGVSVQENSNTPPPQPSPARGEGVNFIHARDGITGARRAGDIGFASLRGGDVIGDHTVMFAGPSERLELTHKASSREIYASGAIRAALWAQDRKPGLYSLKDVIEM